MKGEESESLFRLLDKRNGILEVKIIIHFEIKIISFLIIFLREYFFHCTQIKREISNLSIVGKIENGGPKYVF